METASVLQSKAPPLSEEEQAIWESLVEEGRLLRESVSDDGTVDCSRKRGEGRRTVSLANSMKRVPDGVRRYVVARASGIPFSAALSSAGVPWASVSEAKARSSEMRFAYAAQEERCRELMKVKAMSVVEQSMDEGARPNFAQLQMAGKVLESLDRDHFGEDLGRIGKCGSDVRGQVGGGGFVINVIGDAAAVCAKPPPKTGKALVFTDV